MLLQIRRCVVRGSVDLVDRVPLLVYITFALDDS